MRRSIEEGDASGRRVVELESAVAAAHEREAAAAEELAGMRRLIEEGDASGRRVVELEAALAAATGEAHGMSQRVEMAERRIAELEAALAVSEQGGCAAAEELTAVREALRAAEQRAEECASQASDGGIGR